MRRKIITINQEKCSGCGLCASSCPEGALQIIDGKARLVGDLLCDGLGACLSSCPEDAITVEEREADAYNEIEVMKNVVPQGPNVILAHLEHLKSHFQVTYLKQAIAFLRERKIPVDLPPGFEVPASAANQCPGLKTYSFPTQHMAETPAMQSQLTHWPIQLHLISPLAPHYRNSNLLVAADCVAYALADFHKDFLKDRTLVIACPKLDSRQEIYAEKLAALIDQAEVKSIQVMIMQVPCCSGLLRQVVEAASQAKRKVPVSCVVVGIRGEIQSETSVEIRSNQAVMQM
jgi:NAD-dependent dihydropyrimidine dehydrogenase PreA subunit